MNKWIEDQNYYVTLFFWIVLNLCRCMVSRFYFQIFCLLLPLFLCFLFHQVLVVQSVTCKEVPVIVT